MKPKIRLLCLLFLVGLTAKAQHDTSRTHSLGDAAPALHIKQWIKGAPIDSLEKGKVYVIDFWATWCGPCVAAMPHFSALAEQYKSKATFMAINAYESSIYKPKNDKQIKSFVDQMGDKIKVNVGLSKDSTAINDWLDAFQADGIPTTFVIDRKSRVAWIGHPLDTDTVLQKVIDNKWDIKKELVQVKRNQYLENLDDTLEAKVQRFSDWSQNLGNLGSPDSALKVVNKMVGVEPDLKYMPEAVYYTFSALLKIDTCKAYEFAEQALALSLSPVKSHVRMKIISAIRDDMEKFTTPKIIMAFGAECLEEQTLAFNKSHENLSYSDLALEFKEVAEWYRKGDKKVKALEVEKTAVKYWEEDLQMDKSSLVKVESNR